MRASACVVATVSAFLLGYSVRGPAPAVRPCTSDSRLPIEIDTPLLRPRRDRGGDEHRDGIQEPSGHRTDEGMLPQPTSADAASASASASVTASLPSPSALSHLVSRAAVRATLGGRLSAQHERSYGCTFRLIGGTLYRAAKCTSCKAGPPCKGRPNWHLLTALLVSAVARAQHTRPLPNVQLRLHQGAAPPAAGAPVLAWCAAAPTLLSLPSPYEVRVRARARARVRVRVRVRV